MNKSINALRWPTLLGLLTLAGVLALIVTPVHADNFGSGSNAFTIDFANVGNSGNTADTSGYGAVAYDYRMGTYQISQDQIDEATASGLTGVTAGAWLGSQPAGNMTWYQAAAFVNWLNTSTGHVAAYNLDPAATTLTAWSQSQAFSLGGGAYDLYRNKDAYYFLPSEDEYYKAAYYDPNKFGGAGYWLYATGSNTAPTAVAGGTASGTAVFNQPFGQGPSAVTNAGGLSPYGTMGQTGNVWEWQETDLDGVNDTVTTDDRAIRGGAWYNAPALLQSSARGDSPPEMVDTIEGFRVASVANVVPEPSSVLLILGPGLTLLLRRRRQSGL